MKFRPGVSAALSLSGGRLSKTEHGSGDDDEVTLLYVIVECKRAIFLIFIFMNKNCKRSSGANVKRAPKRVGAIVKEMLRSKEQLAEGLRTHVMKKESDTTVSVDMDCYVENVKLEIRLSLKGLIGESNSK